MSIGYVFGPNFCQNNVSLFASRSGALLGFVVKAGHYPVDVSLIGLREPSKLSEEGILQMCFSLLFTRVI